MDQRQFVPLENDESEENVNSELEREVMGFSSSEEDEADASRFSRPLYGMGAIHL